LSRIYIFVLVAGGEEALLIGLNETDDDRQETKVSELISFDSEHHASGGSSLNNNAQDQTKNVSNNIPH
jgi:hypothetical protein